MSNDLFSSHWYKVAKLKPILHGYINIHRHNYRGLLWYLLENTINGRSHRFNPAAYQFIGLLDGQRTVDDIFTQLQEQVNHAPNQEEILQLLGQLHTTDLIKSNQTLSNTEELFERQAQQKRAQLQQRFINPLAQKIPLWNPENFLNKHYNKVNWIFNKWAAITWLLLIFFTVIQSALNWPQISQHFSINALSPYNLLFIFLLYPPIKFLHELGHAFTAKLEGGEVHEMGINFLMFMPVPYIDVSTATHFRSKYKRMFVSVAGILVESFLAALGMLLFLAAEPGFIQNVGFNIFIIGGISSLFFNGNPLLKFDGYYILADFLSIPNLYKRSFQYWSYFFQRYLFGLKHTSSPASAPGEAPWFIIYSLSSLLYRLYILWFICIYVTDKFFFLGALLALWLISVQIIYPLYKAFRFVISSSNLANKRNQGIMTSLTLLLVFISAFSFIPLPSYTMAEGVVWLPDEAQLKAEQDGFAGSPQVSNNQKVQSGTSIVYLSDPFLESKVKIAKAKVRELKSHYRAKRGAHNVIETEKAKEALRVAKSELSYNLSKINSMSVIANKTGKVLLIQEDDLQGRFVRHGDLLGYIINDDQPPTIRMAIRQDNMGQLRQNIVDINLRLAINSSKEYPAKIIRQTPEATNRLPSAALSTQGGGKIVTIPGSKDNLITQEKIFLVDLLFDPQEQEIPLGTRAYVRINHGGEALATQWYRRIRQVFLRHINV
ncbi:MAG: hypothetical protein KAH20_00690 [Methylococcales bacterium]|nr:hypothetical protein [Methylococcales bacterium]